jgi:hypothetical protein
MRVSTHVCGSWVRRMFTGELYWGELPPCLEIGRRVQINTHAERHVSTTALFAKLREKSDKAYIFQWDGVNDHLTFAAHSYGLDVAALYDTSGGAGILPGSWPAPSSADFWFGYAGGLGPENVVEQITKIEDVVDGRHYWIDMERSVRSEDDSRLDLDKVRRVLEQCAPMVVS